MSYVLTFFINYQTVNRVTVTNHQLVSLWH